MKYCTPEMKKIAKVTEAVRFDQSLATSVSGADLA